MVIVREPAPPPTGTWGISPTVRRALARTILELRAAVEDDYRKHLTALGLRATGIVPAGRTLDANEQRARAAAEAVIARDVQAGASQAEAVEGFVRECAFTFLNRMVGLRCLDERELLVVDGQPETAIKTDPARNASSLYWRIRNALPPSTNPREVWRETLRRAGAAISTRIRVLFDPDSEYAALLPSLPALQRVVEALNTESVPSTVWAEDEVLGWVYQYYNAEEKDAAYARLAKGKKLERPEELAAATTLYTERYMVDYLLQNTLGALWVEMHPESPLPERWPYYVKPAEGNPAVERKVRPLREVTLIDPACGSGHFLVRAFELLVEMYREEGREAEDETPHLILERNLHGIDIDGRAVQIAALALYLKACALAGPKFRPRTINLVAADAVLPGDEPASEFLARFKGDRDAEALMRSIWQGLKNVREFGSLLHPERAVDEVIKKRREQERGQLWQQDDAEWDRWKRALLHGLREEFERQAQSEDLGQRLFGEEAAKGVSLVEALGRKYDVVVMNPPYAGSKNLSERLKKFVEREYKEGKRDLYAAFIQRCREFAWRSGYVGMVTQQSWLFMRSYAALRKALLARVTAVTLAHLGPRAFEEIGGEVVNTVVFTLRNTPPSAQHRLEAFRLVGPKVPAEKELLLRRALAGDSVGVITSPRQTDFLGVPETPLVYWLRPKLLEVLQQQARLEDIAPVRQGIGCADTNQFVRFFWEVKSESEARWRPYAKGGGYVKWEGLTSSVVDWDKDGEGLKKSRSIIPSEHRYGSGGLTYTDVATGSMSCRVLPVGYFFSDGGPGIFPEAGADWVLAFLNSRCVSYLLRVTSPSPMHFRMGYVGNLPLPSLMPYELSRHSTYAVLLKSRLVSGMPFERLFTAAGGERGSMSIRQAGGNGSLVSVIIAWQLAGHRVQAILHTVEALVETRVADAFELDRGDRLALIHETGTPAGWYPMLSGHDTVPDTPEGVVPPLDLAAHLRESDRRRPSPEGLALLQDRLRTLFRMGPGTTSSDGDEDSGQSDDDQGNDEDVSLGARIPIPAETFLEELAQKLEVHPISVYWLLHEMCQHEGLVSPPELKRHLEDYASVTVLRQLGYRWPEQDAYERVHGPIMDPSLVDEDGIIPLVPCGDQPTATQRIRQRLERDFGEEGADRSEQEFRQWVGRDLGDWLRRDFFKRHVQQFKQRPIAWHFVSPERTFEAFVLYHRLSRATLQKLRAQYAGGLIARLRAEQERARQAGKTAEVSSLQFKIEDVEEFRSRIEKIERGDELKYRIRCRWKGEEETGRPGPYDFDIDDGVKVNLRPFQEAGLLAVKEVIKKW